MLRQVLLLLAFCALASEAATCCCPPAPERTYTFTAYAQNVIGNGSNNFTDVYVAGVQGEPFSLAQYGTINVFDDPVTTTANPNSTVIGRARGTSFVTALDGSRLLLLYAIQFTSGPYSGSTIVVKGLGNPFIGVPAPLAIVGGTNNFSHATGNMTLTTISQQGSSTVLQATTVYTIRP
ncbi:hypothetical protein MLD38_003042 [Melastoma candidum]|uniref:Uncharacterized protein n=1 Tax=Melastoma candidum TaxID=119954 RepID=A0ACB9S0K0_9MYRT|nr:hypothetical protein MLD38_003042 [Melastoma candidum]